MGLEWERQFGAPLRNWRAPVHPADDERVARIDGRFMRLERLRPDHAEALFAQYQDAPEVWDYMPNGPFETADALRTWIASIADSRDPLFFAVIDLQTDTAKGVLSYLRIVPEIGSIELGWISLAPALQGTPAATEAFIATIRWAFEAGYRRFEWKCDALNLASRRAALRLGLSYEGVFRQATIYKGRNRDTAWFAAIDAEWPALSSAYDRWLAHSNFDLTGQQIARLSVLTAPVLVARDPVFDAQAGSDRGT
ncbi:GNAT family acetyltransferase [Thioclava dalianensis]|uniref:GNAT family acetyltransferase n=1 Tax=Thioclava dalianensis TaxID=1185766 RepID=A0A074U665_9RHOB|nr:GNAT family protein [Thioclava dalianensis]KEP70142.1 GNAT family acetyltransferase [Thioclava dalianensis]SFM80267.1 Protein N-acetyltransferase, RimJ/RimL family [Thioclava dalianensis]